MVDSNGDSNSSNDGQQRQSAAARHTRTIGNNLAYATPEKRKLGIGLRPLTPKTDTNRVGCYDPLSDMGALFLQLGDHIGQLCGIF
jgi:hypothetical protein